MEEISSSSKVTVEYFDPYGVYQLLSPGLLPRLPLRNLHWESHSGPLRSISTLHVDLIPSAQDVRPLSTIDPASASTSSLSRVKSEDSGASGDDGFRTQTLGQPAGDRPESVSGPSKPVKGRRHQIPGLRQTPYLKLFFLRCDDNDTYKSQARRQVREWIKDHTPSAQSTSKNTPQENHDAYEWMIVHVIVPNTAAATQPRTSGKSSESNSGSNSEKSGTRWRGGGSSTILEKLRADFNGTSKSAIDRVAQIRIGINDVPYDMLPRVVPAIPGSYTETPQENENAWMDLVSKLKSLILASFDMRVSQYEEDIREKDAQRSLPGWNFCTFFVLKEGLARGFESVGLVEDSLVGYDELSVGLDAIIRDQSSTGSSVARGGSFLPFTKDLKRQAERARAAILRDMGAGDAAESEEPIDLQSTATGPERDDNEIPLDASKKQYRELILGNDISIFDFRCYLFARQLSLLLRLANAWSSQEELLAKLREQRESSLQGVAARLPASQPADDAEVLGVLGEVCRRSMDFVASISRIMRDDISVSFKASRTVVEGQAESKDPIMTQVVDNIVSSFTFAIAQQILAQTSTKSLPIPPSTLAPPSSNMGLDGQEPKAAIPEPKTMMHPARSSSLALRSSSREPPSPGLFPGGRRSSVPEQGAASSPFLKAGLEQLAGHRAELYVLSRSILERVGKERGWSSGWAEMGDLHSEDGGDMEEVDLNQEATVVSNETSILSKVPTSSHGISNKLLETAIDNKDDFYRLYETLTDKALRHFTVANHIQSVQSSMADLAILKYYLRDYAAAASYFYRMTPFYGEGGWEQVELSMLVMYAKCLRELQRNEEYVRVVLKLLSKSAMIEKERLLRKSTLQIGRSNSLGPEVIPSESYLTDLVEITKSLSHEVHVPMQTFFGSIEVDNTVRYHPEMDSFGLQLRLHYLLSGDMTIEKAKVKIVPLTGETSREIWLEMDGETVLRKGIARLAVKSNIIIPGNYTVTHVILQTSNINLQYDHHGSSTPTSKGNGFFKSPKLLIYHRSEAFDLKLSASRYMHLDRNRSLELTLSPGWNNVTSGELHVRAATAGLRVQTSEAKVVDGSLTILKQSEPGIVHFGGMEQDSSSKLVMPFNLEHELSELSLKIEIHYTTEKGTFFFATTPSVSIMLPLGVNVQDVFKHKALFSKFTISPSTSSPLRLLSSRLEGSEAFEAEGGAPISKPLVIFPRQPATMLYKITKSRSQTKPQTGPRKSLKSLSLVLNYTCIDEEIENAVSDDLIQFLEKSSLRSYSRLILPIVLSELRAHLSPYDFERIAILNEITNSILAPISWRNHFSGLGYDLKSSKDTALELEACLQNWVQQKSSIPLAQLSIDQESVYDSRSIVIPVDVPSVTVVHTADLKLLDPSPTATNIIVGASNQPISASLDIKWTRIWDTQAAPDGGGTQVDHIEFYYQISGAPDTWLIGGRRKGHFRIPRKHQGQDNKEKLSFPVVLIPLREGFLPFPNVDIKVAHPVKAIGHPGEDTSRTKKPVVSCETDYKNAGETLRVISDARKTTVSLDASGPQGGAWLLESERIGTDNGGIVLG